MESLPPRIKSFIFEHIDSAEMLEILLLLRSNPDRYWDARALSVETRGNQNSIGGRLARLHRQGLIEEGPTNPKEYRYAPSDKERANTVAELADLYATKRHRVLELIFSPFNQQARLLADAFRLKSTNKGEDENNG